MGKYIGFDISSKDVSVCVIQKNERERFTTIGPDAGSMRKFLINETKDGSRVNVTFEISGQAGFLYDSMTLPIAAVGGKGVISVVANIAPADVKALTDAILEGDFTSALKWHKKLFALSRGMLSLASNPIPVKAAMAMLNLSGEEMRLPLVPMEESKKALLRKTLQEYGLLK